MQHEQPGLQPLDRRGSRLAILAVIIAAGFESLWTFAPQLLATPLWPGAALTWALALGLITLAAITSIAWLICRGDDAGGAS